MSGQKRCGNCEKDLSKTYRFCPYCGIRIGTPHDEIVNIVAASLEKRGFGISDFEHTNWQPMINVTVVPFNKRMLRYVLEHRWLLGEAKHESKINVDVLGCKRLPDGRLDYDSSIAVEVSVSSDVKTEVEKLTKVPTKAKIVVTDDLEGKLGRIPIVPFSKLEKTLDKISG
jgi:hypothetical protein